MVIAEIINTRVFIIYGYSIDIRPRNVTRSYIYGYSEALKKRLG